MVRGIALLLVIPACADGPATNARLADLPDLELSLQLWAPSDTEPTKGFVTLGYDADRFRTDHGGDCATLDGSFAGAIAGTAMRHAFRGDADDEFDRCAPPGIDFEIQLDERSTIVAVSDDSMTVSATYAAGAFTPHAPLLRSPAEWRFAGAEPVTIAWSNPEDLVGFGPESMAVYFHTGDLRDTNFFPLAPQFAGDEIRFAIPAAPPVTGPGFIIFGFGYSVGDAATCDGAASCTFSAARGYSHSVTIAD